MKLKTFDAQTTQIGEKTISVNLSTGLFSFSKGASTMMGLKEGDKIAFHKNLEEDVDWYISIAPNGFTLRQNAQQNLVFNSTSLKDEYISDCFTKIIGYTGVTFLIGCKPVGIDGYSYWPIIYASVKGIKEGNKD